MADDEIAQLRAEIEELRAALSARGVVVGRRRLFTGALAGLGAAAAGTAVVSTAEPAAATTENPDDNAHPGHFTSLVITDGDSGNGPNFGTAVSRFTDNGATIVGAIDGSGYIVGENTALTVTSVSPAVAIVAQQTRGIDEGGAVGGLKPGGSAINATSELTPALIARTTRADAHADAVVITNKGSGRAILAESSGAASTVTIANSGNGPALYAAVDDANSAAVIVNSGTGPAATFAGGRAAVNLRAGSGEVHPARGTLGDLYVDRHQRLWFCKGGATWHQLA